MEIIERPRRLRGTAKLRAMVRDTNVLPSTLILPIFIREGITSPRPITGMPGVLQHTKESFRFEIDKALNAGIGGVMIFGIPQGREMPRGRKR
jgi:porphobilinogen synthase